MNFSVLISVYYRETPAFLEAALNSTIDQTLKPAEIVLVKDGPLTSGLDEVINNFVLRYPNLFKIVKLPENRGLGNALRVGIMECSNELVARMDSDDINVPDRFEKQINYMMTHPEVDIVGGVLEEFKIQPGDTSIFRILPADTKSIIKFSKLRNPLNHATVVYKRSKVIAAGNYDSDFLLFEDYSLFLRMLDKGCVVVNLPDVILNFRAGEVLIDVIKRRSGWEYLKTDWRFANHNLKNKHFSIIQWFKYILVRIPIKLLPSRIIILVYRAFLRKK